MYLSSLGPTSISVAFVTESSGGWDNLSQPLYVICKSCVKMVDPENTLTHKG